MVKTIINKKCIFKYNTRLDKRLTLTLSPCLNYWMNNNIKWIIEKGNNIRAEIIKIENNTKVIKGAKAVS